MRDWTPPHLTTGDETLDKAFRIAVGDLVGNIAPYAGGLLPEARPVVMAGLEYDRPWTRDAAINTWNSAGLLFPDVARATLTSVLMQAPTGVIEDSVRIGGQYWDAIIWVIGAWSYYLTSGDRDFLALALDATMNSLAFFEATEFDPELNLFRGPACYGDGVAAYPARYANANSSAILDWPAANPDLAVETGYGIPMYALSTNALYYQAYILAQWMSAELRLPGDGIWLMQAAALKAAINHYFWSPDRGTYRYLVDPWGGSDAQEALGHAFAILFGIAGADQAASVLAHQHITPAGVPCVWPTFPRYADEPGTTYGRHSGTVWPHVQGIWATTARRFGRPDLFEYELRQLAAHAWRDAHFAEIYHPITGEIYGGLQEDRDAGIRLWHSCRRQTWSATAFLRMVLEGVIGMRFDPYGIGFRPHLPSGLSEVRLRHLPYRDMVLDIRIRAPLSGDIVFRVDGQVERPAFLPAAGTGARTIEIGG